MSKAKLTVKWQFPSQGTNMKIYYETIFYLFRKEFT